MCFCYKLHIFLPCQVYYYRADEKLLNFNLAAGWCRDFKFVALVKLIITSSNDFAFLARKF